jgi:hypothetical protein
MNKISDATTFAFFRERLCKAGVIEELSEMFESYLCSQYLQARVGQIIASILFPVPKTQSSAQQQQCNTREEIKEIKAGELQDGWDKNQDRL